MAGDKRTLKFLVALQTAEFKKGMNAIKRQLNTFKGFITKTFALGSITIFGKQMVQAGKDFEDAMARVKAVSNATDRDFKAMTKEARKLGSTTRYSALEAAEALENLTRNGMTAKEATAALSGVLKLAQANAIGLAEAADIITNTLNMFGLQVTEVSRVNDVLSTTAAHSATNVTLLYDALVNAAPVAKVLGYNIEEVSAMLGALANKGVKGAEAGTQLRMALVKMTDPLIVKKLQEMGVAIDEDTLRANDLKYAIDKLKEANLSFSDLIHAFSQKGAAGIQQMINSYDEFVEMLEYTTNAAGTVDRMFRDGVGSMRKEVDLLKAQWNDFLITMSNKTSGLFKAMIKLAQNLVANFKTVGGSIMNIASMVIPLLLGKVLKLAKEFKVLVKTIKTEGAAAAATMGGWITAVATLVTWVGTALVGAWAKVNGAVRDAKKEMANAEAESVKLNNKVNDLIKTLSDDPESLAGVVSKATELFPEFAEQIRTAADEARKTGNYDSLIEKLKEICELQSLMTTNAATQQMMDANIQKGAHMMRTASKKEKQASGLYQLSEFFKKNNISKEIQETVYGEILRNRIKGYTNEQMNASVSSMTGGEVKSIDFNQNMIKGLAERVGLGRGYEQTVKENSDRLNELNSTLETANNNNTVTTPEVTGGGDEGTELSEEQKTLSEAIEDYEKKLKELENQHNNNALTDKEYADALDDLEDKTWKAITAVEEFRDILGELGKGDTVNAVENAFKQNRFNENTAAYQKQFGALGGYNAPSKGTRDTTFDYAKSDSDIKEEELKLQLDYKDSLKDLIGDLQEAINKGDFNLIVGDATDQLEALKDLLAEASQEAVSLEHALNLSEAIETLDKQIADLQDNLNGTTKNLAQAFERVYDSIVNIAEGLGDSIDEDVKESWENFFAVINGGIQLFETFKTIMEAVQLVEDIVAKKKALNAAKEVAANAAVASSETLKAGASTASAAAGAGSAMSSIPIVGPVLAVAAIAAVIAAIVAGTKKAKFANGGIVQGSSFSGDKVNAGLNSGEMVLNRSQQATLWNLINGKESTNGNVTFKIHGKDLIGTLQNYNKQIRG